MFYSLYFYIVLYHDCNRGVNQAVCVFQV